MDITSNIIDENSKIPAGISRIKYMPYSEIISKNVWNQIALKYINNLRYDQFNKSIWSELIKYVHSDESCKYDLNRSIALIGRTGAGKTKTMQIMSEYMTIDDVKFIKNGKLIKFNYKIISSRDIVSQYSTLGYDAIQKYIMITNICIDDLGSETANAKHYGTELNVIEEIIEQRYSKELITHFTSNLDMEGILNIYGSRVHSRLSQMCNIEIMNGNDYRLI